MECHFFVIREGQEKEGNRGRAISRVPGAQEKVLRASPETQELEETRAEDEFGS